MNRTTAWRGAAALALLLLPCALAAQETQEAEPAPPALDEAEVYRREVFTYQRAGRPDPFQPLTGGAELAIRPEDLQLTALVYSPNPRESLAVFQAPGIDRRIRLRTGESFGAMTVVAIYPGHANVRVDEFGTSRTYSVQLQRVRARSAAAGAAGDAGVQTQTAEPQQPAAAPAPTAPLQRRGARAAQPAEPAPPR
jgi:hypothetical protein